METSNGPLCKSGPLTQLLGHQGFLNSFICPYVSAKAASEEPRLAPTLPTNEGPPTMADFTPQDPFFPDPENSLAIALWYGAQGQPVFPIWPIDPETLHCTCPLGKACTDKHPILSKNLESASTEPAAIRKLWSRAEYRMRKVYAEQKREWKGLQPAIGGGTQGLIVLDIDSEEGYSRWAAVQEKNGAAPDTMVTASGRCINDNGLHGAHIAFRIPEDLDPAKRAKLTIWGGGGLDGRCNGKGWTVKPPSWHRSGHRYIVTNNVPIATAPLWLVDYCLERIAEGRGKSRIAAAKKAMAGQGSAGGSISGAEAMPTPPEDSLWHTMGVGVLWKPSTKNERDVFIAALMAADPEAGKGLNGRPSIARGAWLSIVWSCRAHERLWRDGFAREVCLRWSRRFASHTDESFWDKTWNRESEPGAPAVGFQRLYDLAEQNSPGWRKRMTGAAPVIMKHNHDAVVDAATAGAAPEAPEPAAPPAQHGGGSGGGGAGGTGGGTGGGAGGGDEPPQQPEAFLIRSHGDHVISGALEPISPGNPRKSAEIFRKMHYPWLLYVNQDWLNWAGAAYVEVVPEIIHSDISAFLARSFVRKRQEGQPGPNGEPGAITYVDAPFCPEPKHVNAVMSFLTDLCAEDEKLADAPRWLKNAKRMHPAHEYVALRNGVLHVPTRQFQPPTPWFFTRSALDIDYNPNAPKPERFLRYMREVWPDKDEHAEFSVSAGEWLGCAVARAGNLQNILLAVGETGGGKSAFLRLMAFIAGKESVAATSAASLVGSFGLQPFPGKRLMLIPDLIMGKKTDKEELKGMLLNVSGRDPVSVNRKNKRMQQKTLDCTIVIAANAIPEIPDANRALIRRYVPMRFKQSFVGKEDIDLDAKFRAEAPGILLIALDGWDRLSKNKRFSIGPLAQIELGEIKREGAPMVAFIEDECELAPDGQEAAFEMSREDFFARYERWRVEQGMDRGLTRVWAIRRLREAMGAKFGEIGDRVRAGRITGIRLKTG
jgi:P4 family phage/plasmid primase-like protien